MVIIQRSQWLTTLQIETNHGRVVEWFGYPFASSEEESKFAKSITWTAITALQGKQLTGLAATFEPLQNPSLDENFNRQELFVSFLDVTISIPLSEMYSLHVPNSHKSLYNRKLTFITLV